MANINELKSRLTSIGDAIREKRNETELYRLSVMPEKIRGIVSGGGDSPVEPPVVGGNLLFSSTEADGSPYNGGQGYKSGYRLNSSGRETEADGISITGFMPVTYGQTITFENLGTYASDTYFADADNCTLRLYDANKNLIFVDYANFSDWYYSDESNNPVRDDMKRLTSITLNTGTGGEDISNVAYFRVAFA